MLLYEKTLDVDEDLVNIITYTQERWGIEQVYKYMTKIEKGMESLARGTSQEKRLDIIEGLCVSKCEHHYIFGLRRTKKPMLIVAIFHKKMNLMERLKERLPE